MQGVANCLVIRKPLQGVETGTRENQIAVLQQLLQHPLPTSFYYFLLSS